MLNNAMFTSGRDDWETPDTLFQSYNRIYNFTLDAAANEQNHKCARWFGPGGEHADALEDGLPWVPGNVWLNPPYSKDLQPQFVRKAAAEGLKHLGAVVCLLPARTDTKLFHEIIKYGRVSFLKGRVKFISEGKATSNSAPFPSMIVVFE